MSPKSSSTRLSRRDFIKSTTAAIGGLIGQATTIPAIGYLFSPALRKNEAAGWIDLGPLENTRSAQPPLFSTLP